MKMQREGRKTTLRRELMICQTFLILAAVGILTLVLAAVGMPLMAEQKIGQAMEARLAQTSDQLAGELELYEGYGLKLAKTLGSRLDSYLDGRPIASLNDDPAALREVQTLLYDELNATICLGRPSGVYALIDATVNTALEGAADSRCGVWLRLINVSSDVVLDPETILFRGNAELAREHGIEMHNRWNMELNIEALPGSTALLSGQYDPPQGCYWTPRHSLAGTWEDTVLLVVPVRGSGGESYGICGIELNTVHFFLRYRMLETPYGAMVTAAAPADADGTLHLSDGFTGDTEGTWLHDKDDLTAMDRERYYTRYCGASGDYYGVTAPLDIPAYGERQWCAAVLLPRSGCDRVVLHGRIVVTGIIVGFTAVMIVLALILSRRFLRPILQGFEDIRGEKPADRYRITELEELRRFLAEKERPSGCADLPPDMKSLMEEFAANVKTLTRAEYNIFRFYLDGYEVAQVPEAACISMSTVKKHNGNIYRKLGVASNDELTVYLDIFRRCGCLDRLELTDTQGD